MKRRFNSTTTHKTNKEEQLKIGVSKGNSKRNKNNKNNKNNNDDLKNGENKTSLKLEEKFSNSCVQHIYEAWLMNFSPKFTIRLYDRLHEKKYFSFDFSNLIKLKDIPFFFISTEISNKGMMINENDRQNLYRDYFDDFVCLNYLNLLKYDTLESLFIERFLSLLIYNVRLPMYCINQEIFVCHFFNSTTKTSKYKFKAHSHQYCSTNKTLDKANSTFINQDDYIKPFYAGTCITKELSQVKKMKNRSELCSFKQLSLMYSEIYSNLYTKEGSFNTKFLFSFTKDNINKGSSVQNEFLLYRILKLVNLFNKLTCRL